MGDGSVMTAQHTALTDGWVNFNCSVNNHKQQDLWSYMYVAMYMFVTTEQNTNFKQNIQKNRLKIKELLERKMGEKKSKIGLSLILYCQCHDVY